MKKQNHKTKNSDTGGTNDPKKAELFREANSRMLKNVALSVADDTPDPEEVALQEFVLILDEKLYLAEYATIPAYLEHVKAEIKPLVGKHRSTAYRLVERLEVKAELVAAGVKRPTRKSVYRALHTLAAEHWAPILREAYNREDATEANVKSSDIYSVAKDVFHYTIPTQLPSLSEIVAAARQLADGMTNAVKLGSVGEIQRDWPLLLATLNPSGGNSTARKPIPPTAIPTAAVTAPAPVTIPPEIGDASDKPAPAAPATEEPPTPPSATEPSPENDEAIPAEISPPPSANDEDPFDGFPLVEINGQEVLIEFGVKALYTCIAKHLPRHSLFGEGFAYNTDTKLWWRYVESAAELDQEEARITDLLATAIKNLCDADRATVAAAFRARPTPAAAHAGEHP